MTCCRPLANIDKYIPCYNHERIKLNGLSPVQY
ncbi:IS3 family transposase [Escherichia coli]